MAEILALLLGEDEDRQQFILLIDTLPSYEQRMVLDAGLKTLSKHHLSKSETTDCLDWWTTDAGLVAGAAGYLELIISKDDTRKSHLISWLTSLSGAGVGEAIGIRRAAIAFLSGFKYEMESVVEKSLQQFGDQLYIRHAPSSQQEGMKRAKFSDQVKAYISLQFTRKYYYSLPVMCTGTLQLSSPCFCGLQCISMLFLIA